MKRPISIRKALITSVLLLTLLPMLIAMAVSVTLFHRETGERIRLENQKVAQTVSSAVELFIARPLVMLKQVRDAVDEHSKNDLSDIDRVTENHLEEDPIFETVSFIDANGDLLKQVAADGRPLFIPKINYANSPIYQKIKLGSQIAWSEPFVSLRTGESVISVGIPWRKGVLIGTMNLTYLCKLVEPTKDSVKAYAFIVSPKGNLIAHPDRALVGEKESFISIPQITAGFSGTEGTYTFKIGDRRVIGSVLQFKHNDWVIVAVHDREHAFAPLYRLELLLAALTIIVLATAYYLAFKRIGRISAPILSLSEFSKQVASGAAVADFAHSAGYLEIDELYDNFRKMSAAVNDRERDLQDRNEELAATEEELRHQVEEYLRTYTALAEEKAKLESILSCMSEGLSIQDLDYRVILQNNAHKQMVGDARGKYCYEAYQHNDAVCTDCPMQGAFTDGTSHVKLAQVQDGDSIRHFEIVATPLRNPQGKMIGGIEVVRDISDRMKSDQEIRRLNQELEARVIERTAELELANHELESFSYSVSHDLRAPLRHISSFSSILESDHSAQLDEQGKHYLARIISGCNKMGVLIDDLQELSHVSRRELNSSRVNLSRIFGTIAAAFIERDPNRNVSFKIEDGLEAFGDERLFEVLLNNLLSNAWKYSSLKDEAVIEFGKKIIAARPVYFVKDNGAGFDKTYSDKLFAPFQRLHGAEFEGTGIGLAITQRVVHRHGGKIWADSVEGEGATFYFTLKS
ncbi:MAG: hypothetical protein FIA91_07550 [Geobacter sp.]|nr:hypothetical protein [Geobacter sp.]